MKTSQFSNIPDYVGTRLRVSLVVGATMAVAVVGPTAFAQPPTFYDDFESYADQPALNTVWINGSAAVSPSLPAGIPADGVILTNSRSFAPPALGAKSGATRWAHDRSSVTLSETITAGTPDTPGTPALLTGYLFRNSISTTAGATRNHISVGGSPSVSTVGIGWFNNATAITNGTADIFDGNTFQGKHTGTGGNLFFNLKNAGTPRRTIGWHKFDIEMLPDGSTRYYVDNVLGKTITNAAFSWSVLSAGFGTTSAVPAASGEETDFDGILITTNNPSVTTQPANQLVAQGSTASISVVATSPPAFPITGYQWYFATNLSTTVIFSTNYHPIVGANSATLTINNVQMTNQGQYFVVVSNADSSIGSLAAMLTITIPSIIVQPATNQSILQGGNFTASVTAGGATPLSYQWFFNGSTPIAGATTSKYTKTGVQPADAGNYSVRVTNIYGSVFSSNAALTIIVNPHPTAMSQIWTKLPASFPWLSATDGAQRGLAYNSLSNHVLIASRTGGSLIHVLDGDTGAELYTLDPGAITGGTFDINMVGVADDGAVYVANLTLDAVASPFKLYRYDNDSPTAVPNEVFGGAGVDPGAGVVDRWGDTLAVRGSGPNTQILIASRGNGAPGNGTNLCLFTTGDGLNFTPNIIHVETTSVSDFGLGIAFGRGDTFWAKSNDGTTRGLYHIGFSIGANSGTVLTNYTNFSAAVTSIAANEAGNLLAGIAVETPNDLRLYDISTLSSDPLLLDWDFFTANNTGQATGAAAFGNNRLYALSSNNGILAMQLAWPPLNYSLSGDNLTLTWLGTYTLQSAVDVAGPYQDVLGASSPYTTSVSAASQKFFRLKFP